jgi:hypothetical protein
VYFETLLQVLESGTTLSSISQIVGIFETLHILNLLLSAKTLIETSHLFLESTKLRFQNAISKALFLPIRVTIVSTPPLQTEV